jgi:hypothetical protein
VPELAPVVPGTPTTGKPLRRRGSPPPAPFTGLGSDSLTSTSRVDRRELAQLMGVSEPTVKRWLREGLPSVCAFTPPKHGHVRTIALTEPARERLLSLPRESEFTFTTLRGSHYRPSSRAHHWDRVRCSAGLGNVDLYRDAALLRLVRLQRARASRSRYRPAIRPARRRQARSHDLWAP